MEHREQSEAYIKEGFGVYYCARKEHGNSKAEQLKQYEYRGFWKLNKRDGLGRCYYHNEEFYYGEWKND